MRTEINTLGEFGLIERIASNFPLQKNTSKKGINDDAAVIEVEKDKQLVVSTDMLIEGIHFDLSYTPLKHLGYKAVSVNISDIAAMNAIPHQITVSLGLSNRFSVEAVDEFYEGVKYACEDYGIDLIGGDTTSSPKGLIISITALGQAKPENIVYRNTAQKGDVLCVTGDLGAAFVGLQILEREKRVFIDAPEAQPKLDNVEHVVGRQLKPKARMDVIYELAEKGIIPTSMMDISDGLASEIHHICRQSKVGARVYEKNIPIFEETAVTAAEELKLSPLTCALNGGEDYELLFTVKQDDLQKLEQITDIHLIGYIQEAEKGVQVAMNSEQLMDIKAQGWNHF
ncbi:thiamine-phosphate kinase [Bernardetia sp.]|uniref:thiamine-phosphate kinase n=1 Tax=Bernardetia sp. TaxID=1937974 RepID=UPI0025BDF69D|nr:thiamine-phosphate kinase [Bernardetia sp.]